jgi:hypothetical protein
MLGECKYHDPEQEELCIHTRRPCFGAEFDEFNQKWVIHKWKERSCPTFEAREQGVWKIDYRKAFAGELEEEEQATQAEIIIFGTLIPYNCEEDGLCDLPESIDLDAEVLQNFMDKKYGKGRIKVSWVDIMSDDVEKYPEVKEQLEKSGPTTMVTINGRLRFVGSIPVELIKRELEKMGIHELNPSEREG